MKEKKYTMRSKSFRTDFLSRRDIPFFIQNKLHWHIYKLLRRRTISGKLPKIPLFGPSLINQLRLLGSQQHPQSGVLLTENSQAEINLESTGVIKSCNIFGGVQNCPTLVAMWAGALSCNEKKSREQNAAEPTRSMRFRRRFITPL
jgi:hypothetical protein